MFQNPFNAKTQRREDAKKIKRRKEFCFEIIKKAFQALSFLCVFAPWRLERPEGAGVSTVL
jgi:hypothetical protein